MKKNLKKFIAMVLTVATVASTVPVGNVFATSPDLQGSPATSSEMEVETEEGGQTVPEESQEAETKAEESKETDQKNEEKQTEEANQPDTKEQKTEESTAKQEEPKSGKTYTVRLVDDSEYGLLSFPDMDPVMADEDDPLAAMEAFIKQLEEEESEDTFKAGEEVTVVVASEMGYEMESVSVRGVESGKDYDFEYDEENGEVKLPMPKEDIEVSAEFGELKLEEEETESTAPAMARAATAAAAPRASKKITLKVPSTRFYYGAYSTHPYTTSEGEYAYCLIPRKPAPKAGSYTASEITNTNARKAFYYAYGGPGYATYKSRYGNIGNGSQRYEYSYSHVILSYVYSKYVLKSNTEANYAFYGLSSSVKKSLINKANKMIGMSAPPSYYECYYFTTAGKNGSSSRAQPMGAQIVNQGQLTLKKSSNNTGITSGNNLYSLNGAQYGVYSNKACTSKVGTLTTNSSGQANTLTLNKGTYYIKETKAPKGYQLSTTVTTATVKSSALTTAKVSDTPINDPAAITIYKRDKVTGDKVQGSASLAGAQFTVNYYAGYYEEDNLPAKPTRYWVLETKEVKTSSGDSVYRAALLDEYKVGGNAFYKSAGGNETIPLGTVTIQETKAPDGYNNDLVMTDANGNKKDGMYLVQIKKEGDMTALTGGNTFIAEDTVVRGDFSFTKVNGDTGRKMANIPFKITNTKTGESHTVYTDSDGYFSTESSYVKHSENTNGEKAGSGTWFGDLESMDDSLGAMPYGAYTIEEQICDANRGLILYEGSFTIDEKTDGKTLELGTIVNNSIQISTYAMSMNSEGNAAWLGVEDGSWDISDTITVEGLDRGIVEAYLVDKETGERLKDKNGNDIMASAEVFDGFGYVQFGDIDNYPHPMEGIIDYEDLVGKDIVVYDYIYEMKSNGQPDYTKPIVQHTDLNDEYQTINFSALKTELTEETSGSHYVTNTGKEVTLVDNVTIENLPEMFELNTLWLKLEGKLLDENGNPAKDASGKEITATTGAFKIDSNAELNDGFELTYHLDAATVKKYEGQTLTATARFMATFEDYETGDPYDPWLGIIAQETELDNPAQTVTFPAITSTTVSKDVISPTDKTVSDKVNLDGLIPGDTYTLSGVIVDKETGEPIGGKVLDKTYGVDDYDVSYVEPGEDANYTVVENDTFRIYNLQVEDVGYEGGCYRYAKDGDQEGYFRCEEDGTLIDGAEPIDKETFETTVLYPGETFTERHDNRQTFTFTADAESMTQYMTFEIDPEELAGGAYVIQEQLYLGEAQEITIDLDTDTSQQPEEEEGQAYAVFYSDGSLTFQRGSEPKDPNGVVATFTGFEDSNLVPWKSYMKSIESVAFVDEIHPVSTAGWFNGALNLSFTNFEKLNTENVTDMSRMFYDCSALTSLDVSGFDTANVENMQSMFYNCSGIKALAVENFKTGKVTSMSWMFRGCSGLTDLDVSGFNTENVTQMESMFAECSNLTSLNVSGLNTANVENMKNMFYNCSGIKALAVENFKTSKVTSMGWMFYGCSGLTNLDVSGFNTENVTQMKSMFSGCTKLTTLNVSGFKTSNVTDMSYMFNNCSGLTALDVSGFDTANVENMKGMFQNCSKLKALAVENFKTGKVTSTGWMFHDCSGLTALDVSGFDTANVENMESMFYNCSGIKALAVENFKTSKVTSMNWMFWGCSGLTSLDLTGFDTGKVTQMKSMFAECSNLASLNVSGFETGNVTDMRHMFNGCSGLPALDVSGFKTSNVTDMSYMFHDCSGLTALDVSGFDTANVENMESMFYNCSGIKALAVENFKTSKVTSMGWMFYGCSSLTALDVSGFDTENVTQMKSMFAGCTKLTTLNVSGFKTSNVTDMSYMFDGCSGLTALDVSGFDTANVENMESMFQNCSKLKALAVENFKTGKVTSMGWMFFECHALSSLNASGFDTSKVTNMYCMFQNCKALTGSIKISGSACTNYQYMFFNCSSNRGKKMTVYNDGKNASLVSKMIATKNNGNVVSGGTKKSVAAMTLAANSDVANAKEETKSNLTPEATQTKAVNQSLNGGAPSSSAALEPAPFGAAPGGEMSDAAKGSDTVVANYLAFMETVRSAMTLSGPVKSADEDFLQLLSSHESLDDANQTFYVPEIDTVLKDKESQDKFYTQDSSVSLTDTVSYRGLKPGKSYTLMAQLINKDTGMVAQDADGAYLTTTKTFTPSKAEGTVDVEFAFDGSNLNGVTLVAYESLSGEAWSYGAEGKQYVFAQHQDLNDEDQTVNNMLIDTKVSADKTGTTMVYAETGAAVTDTVTLQGTASGKNYRVEGRIVDQETEETVTDGAGKEITAAVDFTGKAGSQTVTVNYSFDASTMAGGKYVVFESVYLMDGEEKILMATHEDLADKDQTFTVPKIETNLYDASTMTNISYPGDNIELRDILSYTGLEPGKTYTVSSRLVHQDTGETYVDGDGKSMDLKDHFQFTPEEPDGDVEVSIPINGSNLSGCLVAYQTVTLNGDMIGKHEDITSETQTLFVPGIQTSATDKETGSKYIKADPEMTIVDAVTFENMQDGMAVILKATLMDKETGEALKDANGDPITAEHEFVPDGTSGTENVEITFDGTNLKGKTVVVFEEAWMGDLLVAQHKDLKDEAQTLKIPGISTSAVNQETGDRNGILGEEMTIEDTVTYRNLDPGTEYRLDAVLYNKDTGEPYLDSGKTITATKTFTPAAADGEEQVTLLFNRDEVGASGLVVFETLTMVEKDIVVAEHHDIKDANQTITMKGIKLDTVATEKGTGAKQAQAKDSVTLTDKVSYENLKAGKEYSLVTYLLEQASGDPVGERVTTSFTPEKSSGSVTTEISFDGTGMAGKAVVVCQELHDKDGMIMAHADLEDKDQTIKLHNITLDTVATDSKTGTHYAFAEKDMMIQDTVSYQGLGDVEYRLESYLVDQETEKAVSDTVKTTFTPAAESGELTVKIPVDGTSLAGKQIVAYQKLYEGTELIAVHMDPDDADQTILIPGITTNAVNQETGEKTSVSGPLTIEDTVTYRNLEAGADYRLDAKVMVKETGEALKVDGKEVTASKEFTADSANGSETVVIPVDASDTGLIGKTLVVYETLTRVSDQSVVAVHHDINDKAQSILIQPPLKRDAEVTKRILAADFWAEHGNPTFIFEMKGTDINGDPHTYYRSVEFTEEYVKAHTDPDGYVEMTVTFNDVMAGEYVVSEVEVSRYEFDSISDLVNAQAKDDTAIYDLINNDTAASTFTNRKYEWQDYSSNDIVVNHIEAAE